MTGRTYTGKGIGVAVLDTGLFPHADFDSRIRFFYDFLFYHRQPYDDNGCLLYTSIINGAYYDPEAHAAGWYRGVYGSGSYDINHQISQIVDF